MCKHCIEYTSTCSPNSVGDITPPHLTFILTPLYSNGTITVSWVFNEEATVICTLQTPEDFFMTSCVGDLFFMSGLSRGTYTLFIQGTDNAGNVANIVTHTWEVGKYTLRCQ